MIQIQNIRKTYLNGVQALRGVNLEIRDGETLAVVGESGCGKSTLARHLLNLETPTEGQILLKDRALSSFSRKELARQLQMIFQDPAASLNPRRKVKDIVAEPLRVQGGFTEKQVQARVTETLSSVGLSAEMGNRYPHMFSGGQKQRIGIARALITGAKTILCDEPVSALDVSVQAQVLNLLLDLRKERGLSLLFISHDLGVVRYVADRIAVMYLGQIVEEGTADAVFTKPRHPYTRLLLDSTPVIGRPAPAFQTASELPSPKNPPVGCAFASRCAYVLPLCREKQPVLRDVGGVKAACHRAEELDLSKSASEREVQ